MVRRVVLAGAVIVAIILIAVLVNSCQVSARNSALKDYNNSVASLNAQSVATGDSFFRTLSGPTSDPTALQTSLNQSWGEASNQLSKAKGLSVPDEVKSAHQNFVLALQMRADGIHNIAQQVQPALQSTTAQDAVNSIAADMARFYASDVLYKDYTVPEIIGALRAAGITVGGLGGQQINSSQFLPSIKWLDPTTVADTLKAPVPAAASSKPIAPGLHGHQLNSVSVGGTQLQTGSTNSIPASPAPTFTLNFANTGTNTETNVICKVTIAGSKVSGQTIVPQTTAGESTSCQVTLNAIPAKGSVQLTATIVPVPGEKNKANNSETFPVAFQ
jgi:CARDB